jgi:exodeoxyribonuclease VII small subunit
MSKKEMSYADAFAELQSLLEYIETDTADLDMVLEKVKRAGELIQICKYKLSSAEATVLKVFEEKN